MTAPAADIPRPPRPERNGKPPRAAEARRLRRLLQGSPGVAAELIDLSNVIYVTIGEKRVAGERTGRPAVIAYVARKDDVPRRVDLVPRQVTLQAPRAPAETIETDVVELSSYPSVFGARAGSVVRAFDGDIGTCGFALPGGAHGLIITNAHVATNAGTGTSGDLQVLNRNTNLFVRAGPVVFASFLRHGAVVDSDIAAVSSDSVTLDLGAIIDINAPVARIIDIDGRQDVTYWYSVNGSIFHCAFPEFVGTPVPLNVDGGIVHYRGFWKFQMTRGAAQPGQSGALLCRTEGDAIVACGLVFGGIAPGFIYAFPLKRSLALIPRG